MKYLPVHIITILFLLLAACNADPIAEEPVKNEIKFNTGIVLTRGVIDSDENDFPQQKMTEIQVIRGADGITQQGFDTASVASSATIAANSGTMVLDRPQYFNELGSNAHFMAFYPKPDGFVPGKASWTINGAQDIMVTEPVTADYQVSRDVSFTFNHCLAQVVLKLVATYQASADLYGNLSSAKIKVPSKLELTIPDNGNATLDTIIGDSKIDLDFGPLALATDTATSKGLLIFPEVGNLTQISLKFEKRPEEITVPINDLLELKAGYKTVIVATVNGLAINFKVTLESWKPATETEGQDDEIGLGKPGESLK